MNGHKWTIIGCEYAGKYGNLYYYDSTGRMIFQNAGAIGADGSSQNPTDSAQNLNRANTAKAPNTGENNNIVFYFILCGMGIAAVAVITREMLN